MATMIRTSNGSVAVSNDVAIVAYHAQICKHVHALYTCGSFGSGSVLVSPFCFSIDIPNHKGVAVNGNRRPYPVPYSVGRGRGASLPAKRAGEVVQV